MTHCAADAADAADALQYVLCKRPDGLATLQSTSSSSHTRTRVVKEYRCPAIEINT